MNLAVYPFLLCRWTPEMLPATNWSEGSCICICPVASDVDLNVQCSVTLDSFFWLTYSAIKVTEKFLFLHHTVMYVLYWLCERSTNFHKCASVTWMMVNKLWWRCWWWHCAFNYNTDDWLSYSRVSYHTCTIGQAYSVFPFCWTGEYSQSRCIAIAVISKPMPQNIYRLWCVSNFQYF